MGSSGKKHKSEKRRKRSRSPEEKEKHRSHKRHRSHRHRHEEIEISSGSSDVEEVGVVPPPPPAISVNSSDVVEVSEASSSKKSRESLSIAETNILRAKLGLKPLQVESSTPDKGSNEVREKRIAEDGTDMGEFVHKPAKNLRDKIKGEKLKDRLSERREKRAIEQKLKATKGLGESDGEDDDAKNWVVRAREKDRLRKEAEKRAKALEELDEEFGIGALVEEERKSERKDLYNTRDLKGLRVGHAMDGFEEGSSVILTLKDQGVLDEEADTLINVNMIDNERYKKNVERKKKSKVIDDEMEVDPADRISSILSKYDEEIDGEREDSFSLGEEMSDAERTKKKLAIKKKLMQRSAVDLSIDLKLASDFYTDEEASAKFKKPGKAKKIRKKMKTKPLKADDLLPLQDAGWPNSDLGSRRGKPDIENGDQAVDMDVDVKLEPDEFLDVDDMPAVPDDLYKIKIDPDEAEIELQMALNKSRKIKQKESKILTLDKSVKALTENDDNQEPGGNIILNSTAEFCRTLGEIPTYGQSGNREEEEELLDFEREMKEEQKRWEEEKKTRGAWSQVDNDDPVEEEVPEDVAILDEEPDVGKGIGGALRLALSKGYLEKETASNRPSASRFAHLQAQNYSIEDKAHGEDEKFGRRDRFAGPTTDFKEKDHYKPNVKLDYIDDDGRILSSKEAFRYLSHKFHGKGPGKNKVEKRMKKNEQEGLMKQMSSTDTPLRTLTMLQQKQKDTQSAFVVLTGKGQIGSTSSISKMK